MPKENDLEGRQDMGGKHGGQAGMPKPEGMSSAQQGVQGQTAKTPAAGPHAKRNLTDNNKTPGAGTLPEPGKSDDSTSG